MRSKFLLYAIFLFCVSAIATFGQNAAQIQEKYGQPVEAYSVSKSIWMTPEFAAAGQVCKMRLYPKRISATTNYLSDKLDYWELKDVLNQIAPAETRGKRTRLFGLTIFSGQMSDTIYSYENISFSFLASLNLRGLEFKKPEQSKTQPKPVKDEEKPNEELIVPRDAEIVTIVWREQTCARK